MRFDRCFDQCDILERKCDTRFTNLDSIAIKVSDLENEIKNQADKNINQFQNFQHEFENMQNDINIKSNSINFLQQQNERFLNDFNNIKDLIVS